MVNLGSVYYYDSVFLKQEKEISHFHIAVLPLQIGHDGNPKMLVAVITDYESEYAQAFMRRYGNQAVAIIEEHEYPELTKKSVVCGAAYEEDENNLREENRKHDLSADLLERVRGAIQAHKGTPRRITRLL